MTATNRDDLKQHRHVYLSTSLDLIEHFHNEIIEIHHLPDFKAYKVTDKADVHSVVIIKAHIVFPTIYESLSNKYKNIELRIEDPKKMVIRILEHTFTVELLFIGHSDFHENIRDVHLSDW